MVKPPSWTWYATGPCHGIQLVRGVHAGRLVISCDHNSGVRGAHIIYSDDHGATWNVGGIVTTQGDMWPNECVAVELADGRVYLNIRNQNDSIRQRIVAYSSNSGESFGTPLYDEELIDPKVQGSALRVSAIDQGNSENRIVFSNPASESNRILMTVRSSFDETQSWEGQKLIYPGPSAYSDLVKLTDGSIGLLYENGSDWAYRRITFAKFTADWLDSTTYVAWEFNEKLPGNTASTEPGAIKDSNGYGLHAQAEAAFEYVSGDPQQGATSALRFTGSGYGVRLTDEDSGGWLDFDSNGSFTIEALIKTTAHGSGGATGSGAIVAKDVGTNQPSWWLCVQDSKLRFLICDGTTTSSVLSNGAVNDGLWHRVAAVRDAEANELLLYVDGVLAGVATNAANGSLTNSNDVVVGCFNAGDRSFIGDIDYVRISYKPKCLIDKFDGDINGDCIVNFKDLNILVANWLENGFE
jgi:sialidase-1